MNSGKEKTTEIACELKQDSSVLCQWRRELKKKPRKIPASQPTFVEVLTEDRILGAQAARTNPDQPIFVRYNSAEIILPTHALQFGWLIL